MESDIKITPEEFYNNIDKYVEKNSMRIVGGWDVFESFIDLMYNSQGDNQIVRKLIRFFIEISEYEGKGIHVNQEMCHKQMILSEDQERKDFKKKVFMDLKIEEDSKFKIFSDPKKLHS